MFGSTILDLAVGLSLVYLSFSLLCSGIREAFSRFLSQREAGVVSGLYGLLGESRAPTRQRPTSPPPKAGAAADATSLVTSVLDHGLVRGYAAAGKAIPTYVPAHSVALALLDTLAPTKGAPPTIDQVRTAVLALPDDLKKTLLPLVNAAGDDLSALQEGLERRYDDVMDRVSGWYKRKTQAIIFATALLVAFGANVDSIAIAKTLWRDPTVRAAVVAHAHPIASAGTSESGAAVPTGAYEATSEALRGIDLPLGWDHVPLRGEDWEFTKIVGRLTTVIALLLGAPFWFDVLSRFGNLRAVGPKPPRSIASGPPAPSDAPPSSRAPTSV